jgi:hypothetical protein
VFIFVLIGLCEEEEEEEEEEKKRIALADKSYRQCYRNESNSR